MEHPSEASESKPSNKRPNEIDRQIGLRLRKWRRAQEIDANVLAHKLGVTYQQLQKYEKGQTRITASRLFEIAQALSIPVHWFFLEPSSDESDVSVGLSEMENAGSKSIDRSGLRLLQHYLEIEDKDVRHALFELMAILVADKTSGSGADEVEQNGQ